MSPAHAIWLGGLALLLVGERLLGSAPGLPSILSLVGCVAALVAVGMKATAWRRAGRTSRDREGHRQGLGWSLALALVGVTGLVVYGLTTPAVVDALGLDHAGDPPASGVDPLARWHGVWTALWPLLVGVSTLAGTALDRALVQARSRLPRRRVEATVSAALVVGLAMGVAFPINYLGTTFNVSRDLSYFQTTAVGSGTRALVEQQAAPVDVRIWQSPTSDVTPELRGYFDGLEGERLRVEVLDHAGHPALARALSIPGNGWVSFTVGDVDLKLGDERLDDGSGADGSVQPITEKFQVGEQLDKARRKLRKLDGEVQEVLHGLGRGPRIAYVVQGHGELTFSGDPTDDRKIAGLREILEFLGFRVKLVHDLGWLSKGVPDDATLVMVLGPDGPYFEDEGRGLRAYLERGGSLLIALEPAIGRLRPRMAPGADDALVDLLAELGLRLEQGVVASEVATQPLFHNKLDRANILTNRYAVHPSAETLMQTRPADPLLFLQSGWLEEIPAPQRPDDALAVERTAVVRSLDVVWGDRNANLELEPPAETRGTLDLVVAVEGTQSETPFRAMVFADAGVLSDAAVRSRANAQFLADTTLWLIGAESLVGSTESEEDVKIEHSKAGQGIWFYATTVLVPGLLFGLGLWRLRRRRRASTGGGQ